MRATTSTCYASWRSPGSRSAPRTGARTRDALAQLEGVYVPSRYEVVYAPDGTVGEVLSGRGTGDRDEATPAQRQRLRDRRRREDTARRVRTHGAPGSR